MHGLTQSSLFRQDCYIDGKSKYGIEEYVDIKYLCMG